jgi:hypothetical protein
VKIAVLNLILNLAFRDSTQADMHAPDSLARKHLLELGLTTSENMGILQLMRDKERDSEVTGFLDRAIRSLTD